MTFKERIPRENFAEFGQQYGMELKHIYRIIHTGLYEIPEIGNLEEVVHEIGNHPDVEAVDYNHIHRVQSQGFGMEPRYVDQWYLHNTGQVVNGIQAKAGIDIDWPEAMEMYEPKGTVVVAVIDTGVAFYHSEFLEPGLTTSIWLNAAELPQNGGSQSVDDDNNGYVDDTFGWDFFSEEDIKKAHPFDEDGHGTLVAGVIAAIGDNGKGGAGIARNARIMSLRVGDTIVGIRENAWMEALEYAVDNGAKIINMSFGGYGFNSAAEKLIRSIEQLDVIIVFAAGNDANDNDKKPVYPAGYATEFPVVVASVDPTGRLAGYSNYGVNSVFFAAPGSEIFGPDISREDHYVADFSNPAEQSGWQTWPVQGNLSAYTWRFEQVDDLWILVDSPVSANYQSNTHTFVDSPWIELDGISPRLSITLLHDLEMPASFLYWRYYSDYVILEVTTNGNNWKQLDIFEGRTAGQQDAVKQYDLSEFTGQWIKVRFRIITNNAYNYRGIYILDFRITSMKDFELGEGGYRYNNGTSFAAPVVAGVASLIWTQNPRLKASDVYLILYLSAYFDQNPMPELEGKIYAPGIVNARRALNMTNRYSMGVKRLFDQSDGDPVITEWRQHPNIDLFASPLPYPLSWFSGGWIYHSEREWIYIEYDTEESFYVRSLGGEWLWLTTQAPGWVYDLGAKAWNRW